MVNEPQGRPTFIDHRGCGEADPRLVRCPTNTTFGMGVLQKVLVIGGNGFVGMLAKFLQLRPLTMYSRLRRLQGHPREGDKCHER